MKFPAALLLIVASTEAFIAQPAFRAGNNNVNVMNNNKIVHPSFVTSLEAQKKKKKNKKKAGEIDLDAPANPVAATATEPPVVEEKTPPPPPPPPAAATTTSLDNSSSRHCRRVSKHPVSPGAPIVINPRRYK
mmetsp:Transcript_2655/g.3763  ORF Transcript_2655/g.3763 Transcript_2655/m.3763 type:complete len:133 (-) Transcript_2655:137-535(-)